MTKLLKQKSDNQLTRYVRKEIKVVERDRSWKEGEKKDKMKGTMVGVKEVGKLIKGRWKNRKKAKEQEKKRSGKRKLGRNGR